MKNKDNCVVYGCNGKQEGEMSWMLRREKMQNGRNEPVREDEKSKERRPRNVTIRSKGKKTIE